MILAKRLVIRFLKFVGVALLYILGMLVAMAAVVALVAWLGEWAMWVLVAPFVLLAIFLIGYLIVSTIRDAIDEERDRISYERWYTEQREALDKDAPVE